MPPTIARMFLGVAVIAFIGMAQAADAPTPLEEITVTAQKVTEKLRDVPISISVVDSVQLANQHIFDLPDLTRAVPNFSFSTNGNPGSTVLEMRGISSAAGASPVAIYLDDVAITERVTGNYIGQPEPVLLDVQQVEVLRGPQGTLYGASAEAGVLKFHSNPVDLSNFETSGLIEGSDTEHGGTNYRVNGVVNLPLVDGILGARLAVEENRNSGFIDRYSPVTIARIGTDVNDNEATAARLTVEATLIDTLSITATLLYQRALFGSSSTVSLGLPNFLSTDLQVPDSGSNTLVVPSLTIHWDLGWADLTSVSGDYTRNAPFQYDATAFNSAFIGACFLDGECGAPPVYDLAGKLAGSQIAVLTSPGNDGHFSREISQELRLNSKPFVAGGSPFTWAGGLYYEQSDDRISDNEYIPGFNNVFTSLYGTAVLDNIFGGPLPDEEIYFSSTRFREKQYSVFGDFTYHASEALRASVGLRYLTARDTEDVHGGGFFYGGLGGYAAASKDHAITPKASLEYNITPDAMVYATASKGFRLGGPNAPLISACDAELAALGLTKGPGSYEHDSLWNYEVGTKWRPAGSVAINADVFYDKWSQLQQQINLNICGNSFTTNLGSARNYGAEIDVSARPIAGLTTSLAGGYNNSRLETAVPSMGIQAGAHVEGVPDWNASASFEYRHPVTDTMAGVIRGNYTFVAASYGTLNPTDPDYNRPGYGLAGASIGVIFSKWEISLFAKNLFNDQTVIQTPDHASVPLGYVPTPRTVGVTVSGHL